MVGSGAGFSDRQGNEVIADQGERRAFASRVRGARFWPGEDGRRGDEERRPSNLRDQIARWWSASCKARLCRRYRVDRLGEDRADRIESTFRNKDRKRFGI